MSRAENRSPQRHGGTEFFRETLINSKVVIASEAKQSRVSAKSTVSGSPRHFVPRDDGINQRFLSAALAHAFNDDNSNGFLCVSVPLRLMAGISA
ncbi:MAG: hypothetical protein Q8N48_07925 [Thiobacillus sp.]|nr:hypothetical protein [Thiobacillus sp.]